MEKAILNFHFDYLNPSLTGTLVGLAGLWGHWSPVGLVGLVGLLRFAGSVISLLGLEGLRGLVCHVWLFLGIFWISYRI